MIVGVDVSSKRIDLAWLENGQPHRWHQELAKGHLIDRLRSIEIRWPRTDEPFPKLSIEGGDVVTAHAQPGDVTDIAIEYPFGRGNAIAALMATTGVITRQAPPWARVAWPSSGELRAAIGAKNTKQGAHEHVVRYLFERQNPVLSSVPCAMWDEHELDALVACIGWQKILEAQDAA